MQLFLNLTMQLMARAKSWKDRLFDNVKSVAKSVDSTFSSHVVRRLPYLSNHARILFQDPDQFCEQQRSFIVVYSAAYDSLSPASLSRPYPLPHPLRVPYCNVQHQGERH